MRLAGATVSSDSDAWRARIVFSSTSSFTENGGGPDGDAAFLDDPRCAAAFAAPGPCSGASAALIVNCAAWASKAMGTMTVLPGSMPANDHVVALVCRQASSTGEPASSSDGAAFVTLPSAPTSTASSTLPPISIVSASAFSKQRFTSAPCATSVDCRTREMRWSSVSRRAFARAGAAPHPEAMAASAASVSREALTRPPPRGAGAARARSTRRSPPSTSRA